MFLKIFKLWLQEFNTLIKFGAAQSFPKVDSLEYSVCARFRVDTSKAAWLEVDPAQKIHVLSWHSHSENLEEWCEIKNVTKLKTIESLNKMLSKLTGSTKLGLLKKYESKKNMKILKKYVWFCTKRMRYLLRQRKKRFSLLNSRHSKFPSFEIKQMSLIKRTHYSLKQV